MPATKDGRCWACVQRRRFYPDHEVAWTATEGHRHLVHEGRPLCELPRRERHRDPEVMREYQRRYRERSGPRVRDRAKLRATELRRRYGMTPEEYDAMVEAQGGTCATCNSVPTHVDHDHKTGAVRGVLCGPCNLALGHAGDDPDRLERLAAYVRTERPDAVVGDAAEKR